jgi:hypothetical protein
MVRVALEPLLGLRCDNRRPARGRPFSLGMTLVRRGRVGKLNRLGEILLVVTKA